MASLYDIINSKYYNFFRIMLPADHKAEVESGPKPLYQHDGLNDNSFVHVLCQKEFKVKIIIYQIKF